MLPVIVIYELCSSTVDFTEDAGCFLINKDARVSSARLRAANRSNAVAPSHPSFPPSLPAQVMSCFSAGLLSVPLTPRRSVFSGRASDRWTCLEGEAPAGDARSEAGCSSSSGTSPRGGFYVSALGSFSSAARDQRGADASRASRRVSRPQPGLPELCSCEAEVL